MLRIEDIQERLTEIRPHGFNKNIVELNAVRSLDLADGVVTIQLAPPPMPEATLNVMLTDIRRAVGAFDGVRDVRVAVARPGAAGNTPAPPVALPGVKDIIAVSSAKGGVGKSTVATNLALALNRMGKQVGLMDADVYGPSLPTMLGVTGRPQVSENKRIFPLQKYGIKLISVGFFLDDNSPVIWRGPLVMGLVRQFLTDVEWGDLDVLVIDLPPGTGDAQLTLVQQVPLSGAVIVTTPQDVATLDVERGIAMFRQVNTPVLGIVENMALFHCEHCGKDERIFGEGGAERISQNYGIPVLAALPLVDDVRRGGDTGAPIVIDRPNHAVSKQFMRIAAEVLDAVERERVPMPAILE